MALRKVDHPNIIRMHELLETARQTCLVTDLVEGISLYSYLKTQAGPNRILTEKDCRSCLRQVAGALAYLHSKHISHRDIKLDNILVETKTKQIKLIDFGFAAFTKTDSGLTQR